MGQGGAQLWHPAGQICLLAVKPPRECLPHARQPSAGLIWVARWRCLWRNALPSFYPASPPFPPAPPLLQQPKGSGKCGCQCQGTGVNGYTGSGCAGFAGSYW